MRRDRVAQLRESGNGAGLDRHIGRGAGNRRAVDEHGVAGLVGPKRAARRECHLQRRRFEKRHAAVGEDRHRAVGVDRRGDADLLRDLRHQRIALVLDSADVRAAGEAGHDGIVDAGELVQQRIDGADGCGDLLIGLRAHLGHCCGASVQRTRDALGRGDGGLRCALAVGFGLKRRQRRSEVGELSVGRIAVLQRSRRRGRGR